MSDRFDALALPHRDAYPAMPFVNGYGPPPPPPNEPPILWRLARHYWKPLCAFAVVSLCLAYAAGKLLGKPTWQAEATLLYQQVALSEKQKAAYEHPPSLPTLAGWVKEPELLRQLADEFPLGVTTDELAEKYIKVEQPSSTESVIVTFKWPDRDVAIAALTRLTGLYTDYVVRTRKDAILLRIANLDQQAASACEDEIKRLDGRINMLEEKLAKSGAMTTDDMDASMLARESLLREDVRKTGQRVEELKTELRAKRADRDQLAPLVPVAVPPATFKAVLDQIEQLELQIKHSEESIDAAKEELRTLPIALSRSKRAEERNKLEWLKAQIKQHEAAKAAMNQPGGPPARGALEGMDAKEFSVKSPPRVGDKPVSSSRKTVFAGTFLGLMACAFGLLFVYDRRLPDGVVHRAPRPQVIHVTPPPAGVPLNGVEVQRVNVRIQQWVREANGPIVTPPPSGYPAEPGRPPVTIGPDGRVEEPSSPSVNDTAGDTDTDLLAARMQQWLGEGQGPG
jgi:hypothetical protein